MKNMFSTTIGLLRAVAFMEGISFLLLFLVTMPLKYLIHIEAPNLYVGMAHGGLFLAYIALVVVAKFKYKWSILTTLAALAASVIPFGTFYADDKIFEKTAAEVK
jgi:integral membrane protein